jgi:hypothetical protein
MGVTMMVAITVWLAGSLVEYKIVSKVPALHRLFNGLPGMAISIGIGAAVGFVLGAPTGAGIMVGQFMGLATNSITYKMYSGLERANAKRVQTVNNVKAYKAAHPKRFAEAVETFRLGIKTIGATIMFIVMIIGLPARVYCAVRDFIRKFTRRSVATA